LAECLRLYFNHLSHNFSPNASPAAPPRSSETSAASDNFFRFGSGDRRLGEHSLVHPSVVSDCLNDISYNLQSCFQAHDRLPRFKKTACLALDLGHYAPIHTLVRAHRCRKYMALVASCKGAERIYVRISIFIASRIASVCPAFTDSPTATITFQRLAVRGETRSRRVAPVN
jgi:hypothetical protein